MPDYPHYRPDHTELTADQLNTVLDYIRRQGQLLPGPEVDVVQTGEGWTIRLVNGPGFWARLGTRGLSGRYAWAEEELNAAGEFQPHPFGRSGDEAGSWAEEVNGLVVPAGTVVWCEPEPVPGRGSRAVFQAPIYDPGQRSTLFWARLGDESRTERAVYGYTEVSLDDAEFVVVPLGRTAESGDVDAAVEAAGRAGIPSGTIVLICDPAGQNPDAPRTRVGFLYPSSGEAVWARLTGRSVNAVWQIDLGTPDTGMFVLTVRSADHGESFVTDWIYAFGTPANIQSALDAVLGRGQCRVSPADPAGPGQFRVEFLDRFGGTRDVTITVDATRLVYPVVLDADGAALPPPPVTVSQVQTGRDDPYTDGAGTYGWVEVGYNTTALRWFPTPGGQSSDWPYGAAYEAGGCQTVPPGTIVRLRPGPAVSVNGPDGIRIDRRYVFSHTGATSRWAMVGETATWRLDLKNPTAGLWHLRWDDRGKNPDAVVRNAKYAAFVTGNITPSTGLGTPAGFTLRWGQLVPTRVLQANGTYLTQNVQPPAAVIPAGASESAIESALGDSCPILRGNVRVTINDGPLGVGRQIETAPATACAPAVTGLRQSEIVVEFVNALAGTSVPGFNASIAASVGSMSPRGTPNAPGGGTFATWLLQFGGGSGLLLPYDVQDTQLTNSLGGASGVTTADWGVLAIESAGIGRKATDAPFVITAAGYDGGAALPLVTLTHWLNYGPDGNQTPPTGVALTGPTMAPDPLPDTSGRAHRGLATYACCLLDSLFKPAKADNRVMTVHAVEAGGRIDVQPKTVVRVWTGGRGIVEPDTEELAPERWAFTGPAAGFRAVVVGPNLETATYRVRIPGSLFARLRYAVAREANYDTTVAAGTSVWVEPSGGELLFRAGNTPPFEATAILIYQPGAVAGEPYADARLAPLVAGLSRPAAVANTDGLVAGGGYVGRLDGYLAAQTPGAAPIPRYVVAKHGRGPAAAGRGGTVTLGSQVLGGGNKTVIGGGVSFQCIDRIQSQGEPGGEAIPAGARFQAEGFYERTFAGSVSANGRWGRQVNYTSVDSTYWAVAGPVGGVMHSDQFSPLPRTGTVGPDATAFRVATTGPHLTYSFVPRGGGPTRTERFRVPFYLGVAVTTKAWADAIRSGGGGVYPNQFELIKVVSFCPVPGRPETPTPAPFGAMLWDIVVERAQQGTTALTLADTSTIYSTTFTTFAVAKNTDPVRPLTRPLPAFYTDKAAFSVNGNKGIDSDSVNLSGADPSRNWNLHFRGGLLSDYDFPYDPVNVYPSGSLSILWEYYRDAFLVWIDRGRIAGVNQADYGQP